MRAHRVAMLWPGRRGQRKFDLPLLRCGVEGFFRQEESFYRAGWGRELKIAVPFPRSPPWLHRNLINGECAHRKLSQPRGSPQDTGPQPFRTKPDDGSVVLRYLTWLSQRILRRMSMRTALLWLLAVLCTATASLGQTTLSSNFRTKPFCRSPAPGRRGGKQYVEFSPRRGV